MEATTFIYGLGDPETGEIRYVGKSNDPLVRLQQHLKDRSGTLKTNWIADLKRQGKVPQIAVLLEVNFLDWSYWEEAFIKRFRDSGCDLVNSTGGGEGALGEPKTEATPSLWRQINQVFSDRNGGVHPPGKTDWRYTSLLKIAKILSGSD